MGRPINDITGKVFDSLKVIGKTDKRGPKGEMLWKCKCLTCGDIAYATSADLKRGRRNYCKTCRNKVATLSPFKTLYYNYKRNAKKRNYCFELTFEEFCEIVQQDCYYCKSEPMQILKKEGSRKSLIYNGVDRKDNDIGYTKENVVPCCKFCNLAKSNFPVEEFEQWLKRIKMNDKET